VSPGLGLGFTCQSALCFRFDPAWELPVYSMLHLRSQVRISRGKLAIGNGDGMFARNAGLKQLSEAKANGL